MLQLQIAVKSHVTTTASPVLSLQQQVLAIACQVSLAKIVKHQVRFKCMIMSFLCYKLFAMCVGIKYASLPW